MECQRIFYNVEIDDILRMLRWDSFKYYNNCFALDSQFDERIYLLNLNKNNIFIFLLGKHK